MNEADIKRKMVDNVRSHGGYGRRIEDQYSVGFPDTVMILPAMPVFFAEVKMIRGFTFGPTPRQLVELNRLKVSPSSVPVLVGYKERQYYVHEPKNSVHIDNCTVSAEGEDFTSTLKRWYNERQS